MHLGPAQKSEIIDRIYSEKGIPGSADKCGVSLRHVMEDMDEDDEFRLAVEKALVHLTAVGEQELMRRAIDGVESVVTSQGRIVKIADENGMEVPLVERKYSDTLLAQFMKSRSEGVYGDKLKIEHKHSGHIAVPVISQEALMLALESGSRLDFRPPDDAMEAEYRLIRAEHDAVLTPSDPLDFDFSTPVAPVAPVVAVAIEEDWDIL